MLYVVLGFFLLQVRFGRGWCSWSKMLGVECLVFCQTGSTYYGIGDGVMFCWFLDCGLGW